MPEHRFESAPDEPLFPEDDPLVLTVPGPDGKPKKYRCLDRANPPLESDVDPTQKPLSYMVAMLAKQVIPEERDEFEAALVDAVRENRIMAAELVETARWVTKMRDEAEAGTLSRQVQRPTRARRASTR